MHICFLNMPKEYYSPVSGGAISTIIMHSATELLKRGHRVTVLTITGSDASYPVGDVIALQVKTRNDLTFLQRRLSDLNGRRFGFDWPLFDHYLKSAQKALCDLPSAPDAVVVFNDLVSPSYLKKVVPKAKIVVWLQNECRTQQKSLQATVHATDQFLTCSSYIRDWTAKNHPIPLQKITVAPSGVDLDAFYPRASYLDPVDTVKALFIGRLDPNKGPDIALEAVKQLRKEGLPVSMSVAGGLWFYGHGNEMENPYFRSLHALMEVTDAKYLGHVTRDRVPEVVRSHDVSFVLSRSNEPFGLVSLEAMASGCAVIASNRGGLPEACGGGAVLVDPDDLTAVTHALRQLVTEAECLKEQKKRSVARASQAPWAVMVDAVEQVLSRTI